MFRIHRFCNKPTCRKCRELGIKHRKTLFGKRVRFRTGNTSKLKPFLQIQKQYNFDLVWFLDYQRLKNLKNLKKWFERFFWEVICSYLTTIFTYKPLLMMPINAANSTLVPAFSGCVSPLSMPKVGFGFSFHAATLRCFNLLRPSHRILGATIMFFNASQL